MGLLGGDSAQAVRLTCPLLNIAGPFAFFADPYSQFKAERALRSKGAVTIGYYHSHPDGGLDLSDTDRLFARRMDWVYVVLATDLRWKQNVRGAAYRFLDGKLSRVNLVILEGS